MEGSYRADKLDGEYRMYDGNGRLTHIIQYSDGQQVSARLTRAGMDDTFRMLNEKFRKDGQKMRIAVLDEHSVEFITPTRTRFNQPAHDEKLMRELLVREGSPCKLFASYSNLQTVVARYVDDGGKDQLVVPLRRQDCGK
jgi:hypothetical protein